MKRIILLTLIFFIGFTSAGSGNFTICPSGCDYTTLAGFEAGEQADLTGTGPAIATITESFQDTTSVMFSGWTTTASDYISVTTNGTGRHNGTAGSGYELNMSSQVSGIGLGENYIRIDGIEVHSWGHTSGARYAIGTGGSAADFITITNCLIHDNTDEGSDIRGIDGDNGANDWMVYNNIIYNLHTASTDVVGTDVMRSGMLYNNIIYNVSGVAYNEIDSLNTATLKNNVAINNSDDISGTIGTLEYNAGEDSDFSSGTGNFVITQTANNYEDLVVNAPNGDFRYVTDSQLIDNGTTIGTFDTDIIGTSRPQGSAWDIGAFEFIVSGDQPPTYSSIAVNTTIAGTSANFSILWDDDVALNPNGQYIFSTNNTGTWVNDSAINFTTTPSAANVIKTLNSTVGLSIGYRWYATDNTSNSNDTGIQVLTTTGADTCSPSSPLTSNYEFVCSDNCVLSTTLDTGGFNVSFIGGSGTFTLLDFIIFGGTNQYVFIESGCEVRIESGGGFV